MFFALAYVNDQISSTLDALAVEVDEGGVLIRRQSLPRVRHELDDRILAHAG
jgi:hypothetical protein